MFAQVYSRCFIETVLVKVLTDMFKKVAVIMLVHLVLELHIPSTFSVLWVRELLQTLDK